MPGPADTYIAYGRNWANVFNTPFREYKSTNHEGGIATPLIAHWPKGIAARNELRHEPGHLIDIMTTCVELSGAVYTARFADHEILPIEGRSPGSSTRLRSIAPSSLISARRSRRRCAS
jgi:arylsulfatase A-like enzyme